jgi:hypothetical protein
VNAVKITRNTANKTMHIVAEWFADFHSNADGGEYVIRHDNGTNWYSPNGDEWHDDQGNAVSAPNHAVCIDFIGGRLDGTFMLFVA